MGGWHWLAEVRRVGVPMEDRVGALQERLAIVRSQKRLSARDNFTLTTMHDLRPKVAVTTLIKRKISRFDTEVIVFYSHRSTRIVRN